MLRSAAKNHQRRGRRRRPGRLRPRAGRDEARTATATSATTRNFALAKKVFAHTAQYDGAITNYLTSLGDDKQHATRSSYPQTLNLHFEKVQDMRYGENPHQTRRVLPRPRAGAGALANYTQLQGKELSYNNIADADAAWECVKTLRRRRPA